MVSEDMWPFIAHSACSVGTENVDIRTFFCYEGMVFQDRCFVVPHNGSFSRQASLTVPIKVVRNHL